MLKLNAFVRRRSSVPFTFSHRYEQPLNPNRLLLRNSVHRRFAFSLPSWEPYDANRLFQENSGILWVNNLFPIKVHRFDIRSFMFFWPFKDKLKKMFPPEFQVKSIENRVKEGGAYVYFHYNGSDLRSIKEIGDDMFESFKKQNRKFHLANKSAHCFLVMGRPFVEDLLARIPTSMLRLTTKGPELSQDEVFRVFRKYGQIVDITYSEEVKGRINISYERPEGAIAARNCLHMSTVSDTTLVIEYRPVRRLGFIKEQFTEHPRIMFPLVAILFTTLTVILFDPIRSYFIKSKMDEPFKDNVKQSDSFFIPWEPRNHLEETMQSHFNSHPRAITLVTGPKGSGKSSLIRKVLTGRKNVLHIDCSQHITSDEDFVETLTKGIGFFPSFSFISSMGNMMDSLIPTGKGAFTSTTNTQISTIFGCLNSAILGKAKKYPANPHQVADYSVVVFDGFLSMVAHMEDREKANLLLDSILNWAVMASHKKAITHVVFVSSDQFSSDFLGKLIDQRGGGRIDVFDVGDVPSEIALEYIQHGLPDRDSTSLEYAVKHIGGRFNDLEMLLHKVFSGIPIKDSVDSMVSQAIHKIRSEGFGLDNISGSPPIISIEQKKLPTLSPKWTKAQLWETIRRLSLENKDSIPYDELLFSVFLGDEAALNSVITSNLLRVYNSEHHEDDAHLGVESTQEKQKHHNGTGQLMVTAFSPLYRSAFQEMVADPVLSLGMGIIVKKSQIDDEMAKLTKVEDELAKLQGLTSKGYFFSNEAIPVAKRRYLLEEKLKDLTLKIEELDKELKSLQKEQQKGLVAFEREMKETLQNGLKAT